MAKKWYKSYVSRKKERKNIFLGVLLFLFLCMAFFLVHRFVIGMYRTESSVMNPVLSAGDCVISTPFYFPNPAPGSGDVNSKRGDIVVINPSYSESLPFPLNIAETVVSFASFQQFYPFRSGKSWGNKPVIRRIVGFPGDILYMKDFILYIKPAGQEHFLTEFELIPHEKNYNIITSPLPENWSENLPFSGSFKQLELKEDEFFVLCDNRIAVNDSRTWGVVNSADINGKVVFRYWPLPDFGSL